MSEVKIAVRGRRAIFASLALLSGCAQWLALWWLQGRGGDRLLEEVFREGNIALLILSLLLWAAAVFGLLVLGFVFLLVALLRRERPATVLWGALVVLALLPMFVFLTGG